MSTTPDKSEPTHGMGCVYSEMIERHQQIMWTTFGMPEFSDMIDFYKNAVDIDETAIG